MNTEKQRIAIAEVCGLKNIRRIDDYSGPHLEYGEYPDCMLIPDYLSDLNAMHEAEKTLSRAQRTVYMGTIWECGFERNYRVPEWRRENGSYATHASFFLAHATASQRAEAFLRTIGKWEE